MNDLYVWTGDHLEIYIGTPEQEEMLIEFRKSQEANGIHRRQISSTKRKQYDDIAKHRWVEKHLGKPMICEVCQINKGRFEWANISRTYKKDITDWIRLCKKCHVIFDMHKLNVNQLHERQKKKLQIMASFE